ncbi:MAG: TolC family protein, partial [Longimicrobiales bacterium]
VHGGFPMKVLRTALLALVGASPLGFPVVAGAQAAGDSAPVVGLAEARRRALAVDPDAVAARSQLEAAEWERRSSWLDLLTPVVTAGTSYTHFSDPFFNFGTGNISPNATSATVQAEYTLFGTRKFSALRRSRASVESAEASETASRFRTMLAADVAYYAVLADHELARVEAERLSRAREQFDVARVRVLAGEAIATDSLQLLLEANRAQLAVLRRDSALAVSRLRLGRQIGLPGPAEAAAIDTTMPPPLPLSQTEAVAEALARGPEFEAARAAERRADAMLSAERASYLPNITVGATTGAYDSEFYPTALKRSQVAITVALPIWDGGSRELAVAQARAERDAARAQREDRERSAAEAVAQAYYGYHTARESIELAAVGATVAAETYRVQGVRYREGATTILDLLEAQVALSEADAAVVQARYAARLALARLEALLGRRIFDTADNDSDNR